MDEVRHGRRAATVWAVLTVAGIAAAFGLRQALPHLLPIAASKQAADENFTLELFTIVAVPIAMVVWGIAGYSVWTGRSRGGAPAEDGPPLHRSPKVQGTWLAVTATLCLFFVIYGLALLNSASAARRPLVVDVTGQQWIWTFRYPEQGNVTSTKLVLPTGRQVLFRVTSLDVNHSFWIPDLGVKIDANAGQVTTTAADPTRVGSYRVECAELCGLYHAYMETRVNVVDRADFAAWIRSQGGAAA